MLRLQDAAVAIWGTMRVEYVAGRHGLQRTSDEGAAGGRSTAVRTDGPMRRSSRRPWRR